MPLCGLWGLEIQCGWQGTPSPFMISLISWERNLLHKDMYEMVSPCRWIFSVLATSSLIKSQEGIPIVPWDHCDHSPLCLTFFNPRYSIGSKPTIRNPLFYPHQVHHEFEIYLDHWSGHEILNEKVLETKQVYLLKRNRIYLLVGLRGPLHRLLKEVANCFMFLASYTHEGAQEVLHSHWTIQKAGASWRKQAARLSGAQVSALLSWVSSVASSVKWGMSTAGLLVNVWW